MLQLQNFTATSSKRFISHYVLDGMLQKTNSILRIGKDKNHTAPFLLRCRGVV